MAYLELNKGLAKSCRYLLEKSQFVLGRQPGCDIVLENNTGVSKKHAKILKSGDSFVLQDLGSRNRTYVNNRLIEEPTQLLDGDIIRICNIELNFHAEDDSSKTDNPTVTNPGLDVIIVDDGDQNVASRSITARLDARGGKYGMHLSASSDAKLAAILEIMKNLARAVTMDDVLPKVLDALFTIFIQADRGFIILNDAEGELKLKLGKTRRQNQEETACVSKTILREVMKTREAIISQDAVNDLRFASSDSVASLRIRSMIVAPLLNSDGEPIGAIQIDTVQQKGGFETKDLEILVGVATQASNAIEIAQLHELNVKQRLVEQDLKLACQVQLAFLPKAVPKIPGYSFFQYYNPAKQIGGDYFDYIELDNNRLAIVIADVVGHGIAAAMMMAKLSAEWRFAFAAIADYRIALATLNDRITAFGLDSFITMAVIVLDYEAHKATIVLAGHMPPIMLMKDHSIQEPGADIGGFPLGRFSDIEFEAHEFEIRPGESLTLYTDGIFEAINTHGTQFSRGQMRQQVAACAGDIQRAGSEIIHLVTKHIIGCEQEDDMCLVIVGRDLE